MMTSQMPPNLREKIILLKAISNLTRMEILVAFLRDNSSAFPFSYIAETFRLNPNSLVRHLRILLEAGLVENVYEKREDYKGYHSFYRITEKAKKLLESLSITKRP